MTELRAGINKGDREGKWVYSQYEETFRTGDYCDTKEDAIKAGLVEFSGGPFYVGQVKEVDFALGVNVDNVLEEVAQGVADEVGEIADDYLVHVEKEHLQALEERMNNTLLNWMDVYGYKPDFFKVVNVERVHDVKNLLERAEEKVYSALGIPEEVFKGGNK